MVDGASHIGASPSLRLRLRVRWRRHALTEALAIGVDPWSSDELALVATRLTRIRTRRGLADGIERILRAATGPLRPSSPIMPLNRPAIMAASDELAGIAERMRDPAPMPVQTVALVAALLQDGSGPLYAGGAARSGNGALMLRLAAETPGGSRRFMR